MSASFIERFFTETKKEMFGDRLRLGATWQGCHAGRGKSDRPSGTHDEYDWNGAVAYCNGLFWGGYSDRTPPGAKELFSIFEDRDNAPTIDATVFPPTRNSDYWSSMEYGVTNTAAWIVDFNYGGMDPQGKTSNNYVRCIR